MSARRRDRALALAAGALNARAVRCPSLRVLLFLSGAVLAPLPVVAACSSSTDNVPNAVDAGADAVDAAPHAQFDGAACMLEADIRVRAACDPCARASCCDLLTACFGDPDCVALDDCINQCSATLGAATDAGTQCIKDCAHGHNGAADSLSAALGCENDHCAAECQ